jgi:hypothetical protein
MCIYSIYSTYILNRSACPLVIQSVHVKEGAVITLNPRKCRVLNRDFVFNLHHFDLWNIFQEHNPSIKQDLPVLWFKIEKSGGLL